MVFGKMSTKRIILRNVFSNWGGSAIAVLIGLYMAPFVVHHLGDTNYGIWILLGSFTGYFGLFDIGVRPAVSRHLAFYRAKNDIEHANVILSTAVALLSATGLIVFVLIASLHFLFFKLFHVPLAQVATVRIAVLVVGLNMALTFPLRIFDSVLWSGQHFHLINLVDVITAVGRAAATLYFVGKGYGVVALACIALASTIASAAGKAWMGFRRQRNMAIRFNYMRRSAIGELFGFGVWSFIGAQGNRLISLVCPTVIGHFLGVGMVTPYSIAKRLLRYVNEIIIGATGVLTPVATALHAREEHGRQRRLALTGGKYAFAISIYFFLGLAFLGKPFITRWMGPKYAYVGPLLTILAAGKLFALAQSMMSNIILSKAKHKMLAYLRMLQFLLLAHAALMFLKHGLLGLCIAEATLAGLLSGLIVAIYGCSLLGLSIFSYVRATMLPVLLVASVPAYLFYVTVRWRPPATWLDIFLYGSVFTLVYGVACACFIGRTEVIQLLQARKTRHASANHVT